MRETLLIACCSLIAAAPAPAAAERAAPLALTWRLVENLPESRYRAELALENNGDAPLQPRWSLYFNSPTRLLAESVDRSYTLTHINGDFYVLRPDKQSSPIASLGRQIVHWSGVPWAINVSDAPSGCYVVLVDDAGVELPPVPVSIQIAPFPESGVIRRGAGDQLPVVTPESRFEGNSHLQLLRPDRLPAVVPTPLNTTRLAGQVKLDSALTIVYEPQLASEAKFLAASLLEIFGRPVTTIAGADVRRNSIRLRLGDPESSNTAKPSGEEAYVLTALSDGGVEIVGTGSAGVFYGIQTLLALLPLDAYRGHAGELVFDAVKIEDAPRFHYRGLHLDVARNFQTIGTVKILLDLMAFYKLNRFHWHLTDDEGWRIEIRSLPELTAVGGRRGHTADEAECLIPSVGSGPFPDPARSPGSGYYSQQDFVDILRFAQERHITVVPELEFPGHARAAIKSMAARARKLAAAGPTEQQEDCQLTDPADESQYVSVQLWGDNVVDVGRESCYRFLEIVIGELAEMYRQAGVPFSCVHLGGDEVPKGAWEASPACRLLLTTKGSQLTRSHDLQLQFLRRACGQLANRGVQPACWEDPLLFATTEDSHATALSVSDWPDRPTAYVWNNVWGWGREDAAYQLANAGYDVVLCNATHLYFDLACEKDPLEPGYYWVGFVDTRAPFEFNPFDVFQNARRNMMDKTIAADQFANRVHLTGEGRKHILGIQGQLWSENLRDPDRLAYMAFPRTIALAERAWAAEPDWATIDDTTAREEQLARAWNQFANRLGQRELPRLDYLDGGVHYRIPPPAAELRDGLVRANVTFPGMAIRYTSDGTEPTSASDLYRQPIAIKRELRLKTFDTRGRGSRTAIVTHPTLD